MNLTFLDQKVLAQKKCSAHCSDKANRVFWLSVKKYSGYFIHIVQRVHGSNLIFLLTLNLLFATQNWCTLLSNRDFYDEYIWVHLRCCALVLWRKVGCIGVVCPKWKLCTLEMEGFFIPKKIGAKCITTWGYALSCEPLIPMHFGDKWSWLFGDKIFILHSAVIWRSNRMFRITDFHSAFQKDFFAWKQNCCVSSLSNLNILQSRWKCSVPWWCATGQRVIKGLRKKASWLTRCLCTCKKSVCKRQMVVYLVESLKYS